MVKTEGPVDQNFHDSLLHARHFYTHTSGTQVTVMLKALHH